MNWASWFLWGFLATLVLTTISVGAQGLGLTRMNIPYILGSMFTPSRDRARVYGFLSHMGSGWLFSLLYVFVFQSIGEANWWSGALIGVIHAVIVLTVVASVLPGFHPRMASEQSGPEARKMLEPPGFLALHYGVRTPISVIVSHAVFGAMLGAFYHLK